MKRLATLSLILFITVFSFAQTQQGFVKTKGRMVNGKLVPGQGLKGASVSVQGRTSVLVNAESGAFSFPTTGQQYRLDSVKKKGYQLVDMDVCPKTYKYSSNPIYIVMETPEQQLQDKLNAERKIRRNLQKQLQAKEDEIEALKEENKITLEEYQKSLQQLYEEQESNEQLISDMAKRYSELDYDQLDEFYRHVSYHIENGELTKADSMLRTRGDIKAQVNTIMQRGQALQEEKEKLQHAEAVQKADIEEAARRCYSFYETFFVQHLNDSAAYYLELRASMDTANLEWQNEAGTFIDDYLADYSKALSYYQRIMRIAMAQPENHLEYLVISLNSIGYINSELGDYSNALQYYTQAKTLAENGLGAMHTQTAVIYMNIGMNCVDLGEFTQALEYTQKAVNIYEKTLEPNDPVLAAAYNNIGHVYSEIDEIEKALEYYFKALAIREKLYGTNHPDVSLSYNNIGFCYVHLMDYPTATQYFIKALNISEEILGSHHPQTAYMYNNIGFLYAGQGEYAKGLEYYNKALEARRKVLGEDHDDTAVCYDNIGNVYTKMGEFDKALENCRKSLDIRKKVLGEDHPDLGYSYFNIGYAYAKQGKYKDALEYYNTAYDILKKGLGESHSSTQYAKKSIENIKEKIKEQEKE